MSNSGRDIVSQVLFIVFFLLFLTVTVFLVLTRQDLADAQAQMSGLQNDNNTYANNLAQIEEQVNSLKQVLGYTYDEIGSVEDLTVSVGANTNPTNIIIAMRKDIHEKGRDLDLADPNTPLTYSRMMSGLRQKIDETKNELLIRQQEKNEAEQRLADTLVQHQQEQESYKVEIAVLEKRIKKAVSEHEKEINAKDQAIDDFRDNLTQTQSLYDDAARELKETKDRHEEKERQFADTIDFLQEERERILNHHFVVPDGKIITIDNAISQAWIDLGSSDNLREGTTFSVYSKSNKNIARGPEDIIGSIHVIHVDGPHRSLVRVSDNSMERPISPGDFVYTPVWHTGKPQKFSFVGLIDFENDNKDDRPLLEHIIEQSGGEIDNYVDDDGVYHGDGISVETRFLVIGEIPSLDELDGRATTQAIKDMAEQRKKMLNEARIHGVRQLSLTDFLAYMGYTPQNRLYIPGVTKVKATLKSGAHSTGTGEAFDDRTSSGLVAPIYMKNKELIRYQLYGPDQPTRN